MSKFESKIIAIKDLALNFSNKQNVRDATHKGIIDTIRDSILNPKECFAAKSHGITLYVDETHYDLTTGLGVISILNGGHTYEAIKQARAKGFTHNPEIVVSINSEVPPKELMAILVAKNTGVAVTTTQTKQANGDFEHLKGLLGAEISNKIQWRSKLNTNSYKATAILQFLKLFETTRPTIDVYVNVGTTVMKDTKWLDEMLTGMSSTSLQDILKLRDLLSVHLIEASGKFVQNNKPYLVKDGNAKRAAPHPLILFVMSHCRKFYSKDKHCLTMSPELILKTQEVQDAVAFVRNATSQVDRRIPSIMREVLHNFWGK
jgi:hypothetical protein